MKNAPLPNTEARFVRIRRCCPLEINPNELLSQDVKSKAPADRGQTGLANNHPIKFGML